MKDPIQVLILNTKNPFQSTQKPIEYQYYCEEYFKKAIDDEITRFLNRYISIIPRGVLVDLLKAS